MRTFIMNSGILDFFFGCTDKKFQEDLVNFFMIDDILDQSIIKIFFIEKDFHLC